ncbi:MAG: hypothetical protein IPJ88_05510 [Myxococcales bacterium]|nr:MAG: hypothetical protein IPJ88_05510 [Myxococcales bacterium]
MTQSSTVYIYTDASFSKTHGLAALGWIVFRNEAERETGDPSSGAIQTVLVAEKNNIRAELRAVNLALAELHWLSGHTPKVGRSIDQNNFSLIDRAVRKA